MYFFQLMQIKFCLECQWHVFSQLFHASYWSAGFGTFLQASALAEGICKLYSTAREHCTLDHLLLLDTSSKPITFHHWSKVTNTILDL